jgi:hypothetical protein
LDSPLSPGCPGLNSQEHQSQTQLDWKNCTMNQFEILLKLFKEMPLPAKLLSFVFLSVAAAMFAFIVINIVSGFF